MPSIRIKQHDLSDCGAACMASVAAYYGYKIPVSRIRQYAGTDQKGTNLTGMIEAAEKTGFSAKGVRTGMDTLPDVPLPAIAHIIINENWHHFVVIYKINKNNIKIMDPSSGEIEYWTKEEFEKKWSKILLLIIPDTGEKFRRNEFSTWQRFISLIKPHKSILAQSMAGAIFYSILGLGFSVYVEKLIDYVIPAGNSKLLNIMSFSLLLLILFRVSIGLTKSMFMLRTGQKIDSVLIMGYYRHIMHLPLRFFETMRTGEIISRINDAVKIRAFINTIAVEMTVSILIVLFSFMLMFLYSRKLAMNMMMIVPVFGTLYFFYNRLNKRYLRKNMEQSADLESQLVESLNSMATIKRFRNGWKEIVKFESRFIPLLKSAFTVNKNTVIANHSNELFTGCFLLILLWTGSFKVFRRELTTGELMSFYALFGYLLNPLAGLITMNRSIQDALIAADRLFQILDLEQESEHRESVSVKNTDIKQIRIENLVFRYGSGVNIIENLNLEIMQGTFVGIVGESGSGKSTLLNLIQGIYKPDKGKIYFGEYDINYILKKSLSSLISSVPQRIDLFSGTILENIALSDQSPDIRKVIKICREVGIEELIKSMPEGLYTIVGEKGIRFSGGEQQKIAHARALYNEPEILLLDEPGSSLDYNAENSFIEHLIYLKNKGKTIILVTHRLFSVEKCDMIFFIEKGSVSEKGIHKELITQKGHYYELWKKQFRELAGFGITA